MNLAEIGVVYALWHLLEKIVSKLLTRPYYSVLLLSVNQAGSPGILTLYCCCYQLLPP
jgi:hypothetical protein